TFQCSLDAAAFAQCSSPQTYPSVPGGRHTFTVKATDPAGNEDSSPATVSWTIAAPPDTTITASPPPTVTNATSASFQYSASDTPATFECALDNGTFADCTTQPQTYTGLIDGRH